jgi:hypothetical protein
MMRSLTLALACCALAGCLADYTHPADAKSARVLVARKATPMICVDERPQELVPDASGYATIPAGRPITLAAQFEGHDFVCIPSVSFTPEAGASYRQLFEVRSRACKTTITMEGAEGTVGVSDPGSYGCRGRP